MARPPSIRALPALSAVLACGMAVGGCSEEPASEPLSESDVVVHRIDIALPHPIDARGGIVAVDLDGDGARDLVVTGPNYIAGYAIAGGSLWTTEIDIRVSSKAEENGLPGTHAPGIGVTDTDGDGRPELLVLTQDNELAAIDGATGAVEHRVALGTPPGAERWEHLVVADFRGANSRDLLLQATTAESYRFGRFLAAYAVEDLLASGAAAEPLWTRNDFLPTAHAGARVADLDGDGRDEVLGGTIIGPDGALLAATPVRGHLDAVAVADVRPDLPGLEVVALEERGGNRVFLYHPYGMIWEASHRWREPQNTAVGEFDPNRPGLEIWCRSRYDEHQKPWVFDARGRLIAAYEMDQVAPEGWTVAGVEEIATIDWTGGERQFAAAKERHTSGDVAIFDPISGTFLHRFDERAMRLYVADVVGDWREELIVLAEDAIRIYENKASNPRPDHPRLWERDDYNHSKTTWNYYNT